MKISITVSGGAQSRARLAALRDRMADLNPAFLRSGVAVLTDAQGRIRSNGPGWAPTLETSRGSSLQRTGALIRSLSVGGEGNIEQQIPGGIRVGTNLRTPDGAYSIGVLMQGGTGVYAGRGPIKPKSGKFLVFELNGQKVFAKEVKGSPARPFLYISSTTRDKVVNIFKQRIVGTA